MVEKIAQEVDHVFAWKVNYTSDLAKGLWWHAYKVSHWQCGTAYRVDRRSHFGHQIMFMMSGHGHGRYQDVAWKAGPGTAVLMDLAQPHQYETDPADPWDMYWVSLDGPGVGKTFDMLVRTAGSCVIPFASADKIKYNMDELIRLVTDHPPGYDAWTAYHLMGLVANIVEGLRSTGLQSDPDVVNAPAGILEALYLLRNSYYTPLSLDQLAQQASMSSFHFLRRFKAVTGFTPMEYLEKYRISRAQELIVTQPALRLKEVARMVGYDDSSYFSKVFRKCVGDSPQHYRQQQSGQNDSEVPTRESPPEA